MPNVPVSVVIICKNAAPTIKQNIHSAQKLTEDVVVVDSGSSDGTQQIVQTTGARLVSTPWLGYGATKNRGNAEARHQWILSLDADEELSEDLIASIRTIDFADTHTVYAVRRLNYFGGQPIHFGEWRNDWVKRLFHKGVVSWDAAPVHENLITPPSVVIKKLEGVLHHYTASNIEAYEQKLDRYAGLMAERYYNRGKRPSMMQLYASPAFSFMKYYLFQLGMLDRGPGFQIARAHALYTYKKYKRLQTLWQKRKQ